MRLRDEKALADRLALGISNYMAAVALGLPEGQGLVALDKLLSAWRIERTDAEREKLAQAAGFTFTQG